MPTRVATASRPLIGLCLSLACLAAAAGCGGPAAGPEETAAPAAAEAARVEVREPRITLTPGADSAAVYLTVTNPGPQDDRLLRVETAVARLAELHESVEENGMVRMVAHPEGFVVPAGGTLELQPAGKHVMLIEPQVPEPAPGTIALTLHFERAGAVAAQAVLSSMADMDHGDHGDHGSDHAGHTTDHSEHPQ